MTALTALLPEEVRMLGLPLHPLAVHAAVVLVPLAFVALVAAAATRQWKGVVPVAVAALAVGGALFSVVASQSGESLEEEVEDRAEGSGRRFRLGDHGEAGERARNAAIVLAVATAAAAGAPLVWPAAKRGVFPVLLPAGAGVVGLAASLLMFDAGHSGAELVWDGPGNFVTGEGPAGGDDADDGRGGRDDDDD